MTKTVAARLRRTRLAAALVIGLGVVSAPASRSFAQSSSEALDREAMEAYHNLEVDQARRTLDRAIASSTALPAATRARLYLHRGVVYLGGHQDRAHALDDFAMAQQLDPTTTVDPDLSTPEIQSAFDLARQRAAARAERPATVPAPTEAPEPAPTPVAVAAADVPDPVAETSEAPVVAVRLVGDACVASSECGDGLTCASGVCSPEVHESEASADVPRFFFQAGYGAGVGYASGDHTADSYVPFDPAHRPMGWDTATSGPYAPAGYTEAQWANVLQAVYGSYLAGGSATAGAVIAHDPDCEAATGAYCVRIKTPGFALTGGPRVSFGYWITPRVGASLEARFQTQAGSGVMSRFMVSARVHVRMTPARTEGFSADAFAGIGYGQIQLRVDQGRYVGASLCQQGSVQPGERCDDPGANVTPSAAYLLQGSTVQRPWLQTGPMSYQLGATLGYHLNRSFGLFVRPTAYVLAPAFSVALEATLGAEVSF